MAAGKVITNDDGVVGQTYTASGYEMDKLIQSKYSVLKALSSNSKKKNYITNAGGVNGRLTSEDARITQTNSQNNNIMNFISKMQKFEFAPPSDNLWTVQIRLPSSEDNKISNLYKNIISTNTTWKNKISSKWKISMPSSSTDETICQNYFDEFINNNGIFLAQNVSFTPLSIQSTNNFFSELQQHGSFFNVGNIINSRQTPSGLKISFLVSNWDIGDILFDPWMAAIAQKGLIEDGGPCIKANIIITEYSAGNPLPERIKEEYGTLIQMLERKEYIFYNCFPVSRGSVDKNYQPSEAGAFKNTIIDFRYDDYEIKYLF